MNIFEAITIISKHLEQYEALTDLVEIKNIADEPNNEDKIIITLIKAEEETTLKNGRYTKITSSQKVEYKNRPIYTNLYLLFSAVGAYDCALVNISKVIEAFQRKNVFTHLDGLKELEIVDGDPGSEHNFMINHRFKLILELQNQSMEQINHMWGFLGGKQRPSAFYKVRMIPLEAKEKITGKGEPILTINIKGNTSL